MGILRRYRSPSSQKCESSLARFQSVQLANTVQRGDLLVIEQYAVPNSGIEDTTLVDQLLSDANSWMILRGMLRRQIEKIRQLCQVYEMLCYDDCSLSSFLRLVDHFSADANARFDRFDNSSSALIQRVSVTRTLKSKCL